MSASAVKSSANDKTKDLGQAESAEGNTSNANQAHPMVKFLSADGKTFNVEEKVARKFVFIDSLIDCAIGGDEPIPMENIDSDILTIMIKWAERHVNDPEAEYVDLKAKFDRRGSLYPKRTDDIDEWDNELLSLGSPMLFAVIHAAQVMEMRGLMNEASKKFASMIKGKTPEEMRKILEIT